MILTMWSPFLYCLLALSLASFRAAGQIPIIFDTDLGNDVDDALALAELHALENRGEVHLLAVTITKDNPWAPVFVDLLNTFYGRPGIPIGIVKNGKTPDDGNYTRVVATMQEPGGGLLYSHILHEGAELPDAVALLRKILAAQRDGSVVIVQVGFSTNLARLLDSKPDNNSVLAGWELAARKVGLLSIMAGDFREHRKEYNIVTDIPSAQKLFREWPGPIAVSGFEIGESIKYPARNIASDFGYRKHHPLVDAYRAYKSMPYDEPLWDPTAVLYAVRPDGGYFGTSPAGSIAVDDKGITTFTPNPSGKQRYLTANDVQRARIREAISLLVSEPPSR